MRYDICPICNNPLVSRLMRGKVEYWQCISCKSLFCGYLDNSEMVGGEHEIERNAVQNAIRVARVDILVGGLPKENIRILDFACGHGLLVEDLRKCGYEVDGYDLYNPKFNTQLGGENYNIVVAIEIFEHLSWPFGEIDLIRDSMAEGGGIIIETSFTDVADEDSIELEDFFYINPSAGHSTIYSHWGLDVLMCRKGFVPVEHFDRNVRVYQKK